jgi:hypothetical protein
VKNLKKRQESTKSEGRGKSMQKLENSPVILRYILAK